ncbi:MAG TPA: exodeoxyribonuclease VII large subunit [Usitatibacter sp.]|nr:exodeoxyribonuclease VII large subunit [Usitatibacter sp.]
MTLELPGIAPVLTVAELNRRVRALLESQFEMLWVAGELSNVKRAASGHWYFCLKDPTAQVECAMFRTRAQFLDFRPEDGLRVEVRARVTLYEPRGNYQLVVEEIRKAGLGALYEAFEKLKARLEAEGLFDAARKRPLPAFPRAIGIVTSPAAAALRDVLTTLRRRAPMVPVVLYPAPVQGEGAGAQVARAIALANARAECDVLIVCRGGGSLEDLWAFNEEVVARAIFASRLPVVSGVGHETDFSIADFVADLRAATPTAAAVAASPDRAALAEQLGALRRRLARDLRRIVETAGQRLDVASRRLLTPAQRIAHDRERLAQNARRLRMAGNAHASAARIGLAALAPRLARALPDFAAARREVERAARRMASAASRGAAERARHLAALRASLGHLDPTQVLARGYSIVRGKDGHVLRSSAGLARGATLDITFAEGGASATVESTREERK